MINWLDCAAGKKLPDTLKSNPALITSTPNAMSGEKRLGPPELKALLTTGPGSKGCVRSNSTVLPSGAPSNGWGLT